MKDIISTDPAGPIPMIPAPPLATFAVTPVGVMRKFPAPEEVTTRVPYPPFGTPLKERVTFPVWVAVWLGEVA